MSQSRFSKALVIAPSGVVTDHAALWRGVEVLTGLVGSVEVQPAVLGAYQRFAGDDMTRLACLESLYDLAEPTLVIAARGGYGLSRLIDRIHFERLGRALATSGSVLCGHSDISLLQLGLCHVSAPICLHGPMVCGDFGAETPDAGMLRCFAEWLAGSVSIEWECRRASAGFSSRSGRLWGGNLTVLCSLLGTRHFPALDGGVLFIEDVNEHPYRVERMLIQLAQAGVLDRQQAVLLGQFSDWKPSPLDNGYDLPSVWEYLSSITTTPWLTNFSFGHVAMKASLPFGVEIRLASTDTRAVLTEAPDCSPIAAKIRS
ncbi:MAG: LD-carboxypeptidase [Burkholderiaceae bacterium]